jgi:hypothetical protein
VKRSQWLCALGSGAVNCDDISWGRLATRQPRARQTLAVPSRRQMEACANGDAARNGGNPHPYLAGCVDVSVETAQEQELSAEPGASVYSHSVSLR